MFSDTSTASSPPTPPTPWRVPERSLPQKDSHTRVDPTLKEMVSRTILFPFPSEILVAFSSGNVISVITAFSSSVSVI